MKKYEYRGLDPINYTDVTGKTYYVTTGCIVELKGQPSSDFIEYKSDADEKRTKQVKKKNGSSK